MSDALSHAARERRRFQLLNPYYELLVAYLRNLGSERRAAVLKAAKAIEDAGPGYWNARASEVKDHDQRIKALVEHDPREWARLLFDLCDFDLTMYEQAKAQSPFAGKFLLFVRVRKGGALSLNRDIGELKDFVEEAISYGYIEDKDEDRRVMLVFDKPEIQEVVELG